MKKKILFAILFVIMGIGIGVGASILLQSNQVLYKNDKTVEEALNDLYVKSNIGDATASDIKAGKKALVGGQEVTGSLNVPSYTNLSGTQSVGAGAYSTLLNGYYNLSDYRIKCGSNSCSACNSCCSCPRIASGTVTASGGNISTVNCGFSPNFVVLFRNDGVSSMVKRDSYSRNVGGSSWSSYTEHIIFTSSGFYVQNIVTQIGKDSTYYYLCS